MLFEHGKIFIEFFNLRFRQKKKKISVKKDFTFMPYPEVKCNHVLYENEAFYLEHDERFTHFSFLGS